MVVLLGFLGLAIDGGRAYLDRRELQAAADAAALGAAYNYMNTSDYAQAEQAATAVYPKTLRLYSVPSCGGYGTLSATCTFDEGGGHVLNVAVVNRSIAGVTFTATAQHNTSVTLMQVAGAPSQIQLGALASALARRSGTGGAAIQ